LPDADQTSLETFQVEGFEMSIERSGTCRRVTFRLRVLNVLSVVFFLIAPTLAQAQAVSGGCPLDFSNAHDYRPEKYVIEGTYRTHGALLKLVEDAHFTPTVEILQRGHSSVMPGPDISFTLRVYPNHHRALIAMLALGEKEKTSQPNGATYSIECWLSRALRFSPDDHIVRMIYSQFLIKEERGKEAEQQLVYVANHADENAFTHNNIGLLYLKLKNFEQALFHAHKAQELGLSTPILMAQLKKSGQWVDPVPTHPLESQTNSQ
jgi:tetratricopeptide (TPR) repeat protein